MSYVLSPRTLSVLHDLDALALHRRCFAYTWKWDAGTFVCDSCGVRRRADPVGGYTSMVGVSDESDIVLRGPAAPAYSRTAGSLRGPRGVRP